jgi:cell fate regulator YaaT (PSP1 superfamily)
MNEHESDATDAERRPLVVAVKLRPGGPVYDFDPGSLPLRRDDRVLVETDHGPVLGTVTGPPIRRPVRRRLQRVLQLADPRDLSLDDDQLQRQRDMRRTILEALRTRDVPIKLVKVERAADGGRVLVYYEAKVAGGIGVCGRELCCSSWLREFQTVSVKMAKAQGLALNFSKLAGQCGRLKCCMRYEYETYVELRRALPAVGSRVESVKGDGEVVSQSLLRQTVSVRRDEDGTLVDVMLEELVARRPDA